MNKRTLYWICQFGGWGLHALFLIFMIGVFGGSGALTQNTVILQAIIYLSLVLFSHLFRLYIKKRQWTALRLKQLIPKALLTSLIVAIAAQLFIHLVIYIALPLDDITPFSWPAFITYVFNVFVVLLLWVAIYMVIKFIEKNRQNEIEKLELKAALQEAELMVLKNQINPHFLFNALNNIRSLILSDQERAREMVTHISELLRYSIQFNASEKVTLAEEMEIVEDYLQLESIQYNDRLAYVFNIKEETKTVKIPPMAIQLLVENAIKHGLSVQKNGGFIRVDSGMEASRMVINVTNTGQLGGNNKREGVGLKNLVDRMKILFGPFAEFELKNSSENTVTASLSIPIS